MVDTNIGGGRNYKGILAYSTLLVVVVVLLVPFISALVSKDSTSSNMLILNSFFFSLVGLLVSLVVALFIYSSKRTVVYDADGKAHYLSTNEAMRIVLYKFVRTLTLIIYIHVNMWILFVSPWSFFGGSWYGGIMQMILAVPMLFLLLNFWTNGSNIGLIMVSLGSIGLFAFSFYLPTLFSNLYLISTSQSAIAGGSAVESYSVIDPTSYYKKFTLKQGTTEETVGPNVEQVTDDVVDTQVEISGRMCDDEDIDASIIVRNQAKYELRDIHVRVSGTKDVYNGIDFCDIDLDPSTPDEKDKTYTYDISSLAKGSPNIHHFTFRTHLPWDVNTQVCYLRTDVILGYHTTSIFPLTLIDYDNYLVNPVNIGNPTSISSFGKIRIDMDVGQQPIPVKEGESKTITLKIGWEQKSDGIVNTPKIFLFIPGDLGPCVLDDNYEDHSRGLWTVGSFNCKNKDEIAAMLEENSNNIEEDNNMVDEISNKVDNGLDLSEAICDYYGFYSTMTSGNLDEEASKYNAISYLESKTYSITVPGADQGCKDLLDKGYYICNTALDVTQRDILRCVLDLSNVDVNKVDMETYLIRADAMYEFHDVTLTSYTVQNCDVS